MVAAAGFLFRYLIGPLPNVRRHITANVLSALLNKQFPSFVLNVIQQKLIIINKNSNQHTNSH